MNVPFSNATPVTPTIGDLALRLSESAADGTPAMLSLSSLAGRAILLFVFGIDCGTCKQMAGLLSSLRQEYLPDVEFIGVCVQTGCGAKLIAFRQESGAEMSLADCTQRELCSAVGIPAATWLFYPTLIFIDRKQRMRGYFVGGDEFFVDASTNIRAVIEGLLFEMNGDENIRESGRVEVVA